MAKEIKCCGKSCGTAFCPYCGKQLHGSALWKLLKHVESTATANRTQLSHYKELMDSAADGSHAAKRRAVRYAKNESTVLRWEEWAKLLRELLESTQPPDGQAHHRPPDQEADSHGRG